MFTKEIETFCVLSRTLIFRQICFSSRVLFGGRRRKKGRVQEKAFPPMQLYQLKANALIFVGRCPHRPPRSTSMLFAKCLFVQLSWPSVASADNLAILSFTCVHFSLTGEKILESPLTNPDFRSTMHSQFHIPPNVLNQKSKVPILCPESCRMVRGSHRPDLKIPEEQPAERMRVSPDAWQALQCRTFN